MIHVALYQPVIPQNTGAIARQCVGMNAALHLIGPIGFDLSDNAVKRAGLDYWKNLQLTVHQQPDDFLSWLSDRKIWLVTKFATKQYDHADFADEDVLLLGNENKGLPKAWRQRWASQQIFIPILGQVRSYNLSNAAAIILAECSKQAGLYQKHQPMPERLNISSE